MNKRIECKSGDQCFFVYYIPKTKCHLERVLERIPLTDELWKELDEEMG